jgi:hypothetical protein
MLYVGFRAFTIANAPQPNLRIKLSIARGSETLTVAELGYEIARGNFPVVAPTTDGHYGITQGTGKSYLNCAMPKISLRRVFAIEARYQKINSYYTINSSQAFLLFQSS